MLDKRPLPKLLLLRQEDSNKTRGRLCHEGCQVDEISDSKKKQTEVHPISQTLMVEDDHADDVSRGSDDKDRGNNSTIDCLKEQFHGLKIYQTARMVPAFVILEATRYNR